MDIEITLEVDEKGTVFINRPHIPYYDDKEDIGVVPLDRSISLYVKRMRILRQIMRTLTKRSIMWNR